MYANYELWCREAAVFPTDRSANWQYLFDRGIWKEIINPRNEIARPKGQHALNCNY